MPLFNPIDGACNLLFVLFTNKDVLIILTCTCTFSVLDVVNLLGTPAVGY